MPEDLGGLSDEEILAQIDAIKARLAARQDEGRFLPKTRDALSDIFTPSLPSKFDLLTMGMATPTMKAMELLTLPTTAGREILTGETQASEIAKQPGFIGELHRGAQNLANYGIPGKALDLLLPESVKQPIGEFVGEVTSDPMMYIPGSILAKGLGKAGLPSKIAGPVGELLGGPDYLDEAGRIIAGLRSGAPDVARTAPAGLPLTPTDFREPGPNASEEDRVAAILGAMQEGGQTGAPGPRFRIDYQQAGEVADPRKMIAEAVTNRPPLNFDPSLMAPPISSQPGSPMVSPVQAGDVIPGFPGPAATPEERALFPIAQPGEQGMVYPPRNIPTGSVPTSQEVAFAVREGGGPSPIRPLAEEMLPPRVTPQDPIMSSLSRAVDEYRLEQTTAPPTPYTDPYLAEAAQAVPGGTLTPEQAAMRAQSLPGMRRTPDAPPLPGEQAHQEALLPRTPGPDPFSRPESEAISERFNQDPAFTGLRPYESYTADELDDLVRWREAEERATARPESDLLADREFQLRDEFNQKWGYYPARMEVSGSELDIVKSLQAREAHTRKLGQALEAKRIEEDIAEMAEELRPIAQELEGGVKNFGRYKALTEQAAAIEQRIAGLRRVQEAKLRELSKAPEGFQVKPGKEGQLLEGKPVAKADVKDEIASQIDTITARLRLKMPKDRRGVLERRKAILESQLEGMGERVPADRLSRGVRPEFEKRLLEDQAIKLRDQLIKAKGQKDEPEIAGKLAEVMKKLEAKPAKKADLLPQESLKSSAEELKAEASRLRVTEYPKAAGKYERQARDSMIDRMEELSRKIAEAEGRTPTKLPKREEIGAAPAAEPKPPTPPPTLSEKRKELLSKIQAAAEGMELERGNLIEAEKTAQIIREVPGKYGSGNVVDLDRLAEQEFQVGRRASEKDIQDKRLAAAVVNRAKRKRLKVDWGKPAESTSSVVNEAAATMAKAEGPPKPPEAKDIIHTGEVMPDDPEDRVAVFRGFSPVVNYLSKIFYDMYRPNIAIGKEASSILTELSKILPDLKEGSESSKKIAYYMNGTIEADGSLTAQGRAAQADIPTLKGFTPLTKDELEMAEFGRKTLDRLGAEANPEIVKGGTKYRDNYFPHLFASLAPDLAKRKVIVDGLPDKTFFGFEKDRSDPRLLAELDFVRGFHAYVNAALKRKHYGPALEALVKYDGNKLVGGKVLEAYGNDPARLKAAEEWLQWVVNKRGFDDGMIDAELRGFKDNTAVGKFLKDVDPQTGTRIALSLISQSTMGLNIGSQLRNLIGGLINIPSTLARGQGSTLANSMRGYKLFAEGIANFAMDELGAMSKGEKSLARKQDVLHSFKTHFASIASRTPLWDKIVQLGFAGQNLTEFMLRGISFHAGLAEATAKGITDEAQAVAHAMRVSDESQFIYDGINRSPYLQSGKARLATQFSHWRMSQVDFTAGNIQRGLKKGEWAPLVNQVLSTGLILWALSFLGADPGFLYDWVPAADFLEEGVTGVPAGSRGTRGLNIGIEGPIIDTLVKLKNGDFAGATFDTLKYMVPFHNAVRNLAKGGRTIANEGVSLESYYKSLPEQAWDWLQGKARDRVRSRGISFTGSIAQSYGIDTTREKAGRQLSEFAKRAREERRERPGKKDRWDAARRTWDTIPKESRGSEAIRLFRRSLGEE